MLAIYIHPLCGMRSGRSFRRRGVTHERTHDTTFKSSKVISGEKVFIVQGKPREPAGIVKIVKATRQEALGAGRDLIGNGMVIVTIIGDGKVYTVDEFAFTLINETG
jgi:hypothetical protein